MQRLLAAGSRYGNYGPEAFRNLAGSLPAHRMRATLAGAKRWTGVFLLAIWIAGVIAAGLLDQDGQHRASRVLAGTTVAMVGGAFLVDWRGVSREAAASNARWWARWHLFSMGWQRSEGWQFLLLRTFGAFAALIGVALVVSGFAY